MTFSCETDAALKHFSGLAPLFPLPNVVLFPNALLPLQIFEPRYRQMTADALEGERLIAMGLMRPGWKELPADATVPIHRMVGLGKIIAHERLDDGRYYLVLRGLARAKLVSEQLVDLPYRIGQLEIASSYLTEPAPFDRRERVEELAENFCRLFPGVKLQQLFMQSTSDVPLQTVCDVLLGSMPLASQISQRFLDEMNVDARSDMLLDLLQEAARRGSTLMNRKFPPGFSAN